MGMKGEIRLGRSAKHWWWFVTMMYAYPLLRFLTGIRIAGRIPKQGPVIIAANHRSMRDPIALAFTCGRVVHFLANPRWFHKGIWLKWILQSLSTLSLERSSGVAVARRALSQGQVVGIFPEGGRYRRHLMPFWPGVGYLAIKCRAPVVPTLIIDSEQSLLKLGSRLTRTRIRYGTPIYPCGYRDTKEDYARFAARIREAIRGMKRRYDRDGN
jgi:1-acyl-sn-glycerol-3-phosphate acyltransferase